MARRLTIGDLIYRLGFENDEQFIQRLTGLMRDGEREAEDGGRRAGRGWSDQFKATFSGAALGSFLGNALAQAFDGAIRAARQFAIDSVREFAVYEQGLLQLKLAGEENIGAVAERIEDLARQARVFSSTDISLAIGQLVKAGYDAETAFALVEQAALGAASEVDPLTGKFGDLGTTSVQLGNILRALQLDTSQTGRVMDVLAKAAQDSNLDVSDLVDIVARVGPTARLAGLEIEDLAAMAAVLSNNGMEAATIGTGLRSVLNSLIQPPATVRDQFDALGLTLVDQNGNLRDFNDVLTALGDLTEQGGRGLQTIASGMDTFALATATGLGSASGTVQQFRSDLDDAEGSAQLLADTMRDSAAGAAAEMEARLGDARVELGERLVPIMVDLYEQVLPPLISGLERFIELWEGAEFLLTGSNAVVRQAEASLASAFDSVADRMGEEFAQTFEDAMRTRFRIGEIQSELEGLTFWNDPLGRRRAELEQWLADEQALLARLEERLDGIRTRASSFGGRAGVEVPDFGNPAPAFGPQPNPEATEDQADANRDLADSNKELNDSIASRPARDPLVDEAGRIQRDLQRLKLAYEQGELTLEEYVTAQEAHLRRLDGLYARVTSPEQSLAVLRAREAFFAELERIEREGLERLDAIRGVNQDREDEDPYPRSATGANVRARARTKAEEEAAALDENYRTVIKPVLDRIAAERAAAEEDPYPRTATGANVRARQRAAQAEEARAAEEARQAAIAEARERNNQRILAELMAQEAAYTAWLAEEEEKRVQRDADLAFGRRVRQQREQVQQAISNLYAASTSTSQYVSVLDKALGASVRLTEAQRALGQASRDDVQAALEEQIRLIERLLPIVGEGSDRWYDLVAALQSARAALEDLNAAIPNVELPDLSSDEDLRRAQREVQSTIASIQAQIAAGPDQATLALLEQRLAFFQALLATIDQALADLDAAAAATAEQSAIQSEADALADRLMGVAEAFPRALVEGIQSGDIGAALQDALGGAADFFLDSMLEAILGPIKEQLAAAIAESIAAKAAGDAVGGAAGAAGGLAALGPTGLVLGGLALVASMFLGANRARQQQADDSRRDVQRTVSSAPSITYNLNASVSVTSQADWSDPAFHSRWRAETEALVVNLLRKVRTSDA